MLGTWSIAQSFTNKSRGNGLRDAAHRLTELVQSGAPDVSAVQSLCKWRICRTFPWLMERIL
jgi:hypothetical protein